MKKTIKFLTVIILIIVLLFGININICLAVVNEIEETTNNNVNNIIVNDNTINENENQVEEKNEVYEETNDAMTNEVNNSEMENKIEDELENKENENTQESKEENEEKIENTDILEIETIADGSINKITTKLTGRVVGTDGGSNANGAAINLWDDVNVSQQRFIFEYNEEGYYKIINQKSGKLLDVVGSGMSSGTAVDQWEDNGGHDNQKWIVEKTKDGYYNVISKLNGMYLTVNGTGANCDLLYVANATDEDNQKFKIAEVKNMNEEKTIEEGTYKIVLANVPTQSLTVDGGKTNDGANVHIWEYKNVEQQQFELKYDGNGYYEIIPVHSGKRLDVVGNGNEANVDQWSDNGGNDNQRWAIRKSDSGNYNIISKREGLYLDAYQSRTDNGTNIQVYEKSGGNGQEFKLEKIENEEIIGEKIVEEGTYKIVLANAPTQSLTVDGGKTSDGANVHIWKYENTPQQQFNLIYDGDGYYEIIPVHSGKRLDIVGRGNEANVDQWSNNGGSDNQKWVIKESALGNYNIISKRQNLYLDAYQSKTDNGTNIQVYEKSGGSGQEFKLEKIENKSERTVVDGVYKISPQSNSNMMVEASASNTDNDGRIQIWQDFNALAQKLNIEYKDGFYKIIMRHSGKSLTVKDNNLGEGTDIVQYDYQALDSQKWIIRDSGKRISNIII